MIITGNSADVLRLYGDNVFDSCVTDPPYALVSQTDRLGKPGSAPIQFGTDGAFARQARGFMGKTWDTGDVAFDPGFWREVLRVLKPGAHVLAFGGSRTYHRLACAIEDAGFEIRDQIQWLYGSGFPKSHDRGDGWGTALKPAHEPIVFGRKPFKGSVADNTARCWAGGINIDGCRVEGDGGCKSAVAYAGGPSISAFGAGLNDQRSPPVPGLGRFPANVIHDGSDEVIAAFPDAKGQLADLNTTGRDRPSRVALGHMSAPREHKARLDSGSAARFFYCAKASKSDREEGLEHMAAGPGSIDPNAPRASEALKSATERANIHPTVKPTSLMRYLCRLVTPAGGHVLDPFAGSGSTGKGAILEGFWFTGIEREPEYVAIAQARINQAFTQRWGV